MVLTGEFLVSSLSREELAKCLDENPSFKGYFQGYVAEEKLRDLLWRTPGITNVVKIPDKDKKRGDFSFRYAGNEYTIELKSVGSGKIRGDILSDSAVGSVNIKKPSSTLDKNGNATVCITRGEFDILAISTIAISGEWNFLFILNKYLPGSPSEKGYVVSTFSVNLRDAPFVREDITAVLADIS